MSIYDRLQAFVSSGMEELGQERLIVKRALEELHVDAFVYEEDQGARPESIRTSYLSELEVADVYIGIFWKKLGESTKEEYERATELGMDCLIYEKRLDVETGRDKVLQNFLSELGDLDSGRTIRWFNTIEDLESFVQQDLASWQTRIVRKKHAHREVINLSLAEKRDRNALLLLLGKVRDFWIGSVLRSSTGGDPLIDIESQPWEGNVNRPWDMVLELPDQSSNSIASSQPIVDVFEDVGRTLLILGAPGSGKTTSLLDLTRELAEKAEHDPVQPIPVVFNLSSWKGQSFVSWLADELKDKYQVPRKVGSAWLDKNWLLPMLDGLDEVSFQLRTDCVDAIQHYLDESGVTGLVVSCRLFQYEALPRKLKMGGAMCLQDLNPEQIEHYLEQGGSKLSGLREALASDTRLKVLAETPLMLQIMGLAYADSSKDIITSGGQEPTSLRENIFNLYVERMLSRRKSSSKTYPGKRVVKYLTWIASQMQRESSSVLLIEHVKPDWLRTVKQRYAYQFLMATLATIIFLTLVGAIAALLVFLGGGIVAVMIWSALGSPGLGIVAISLLSVWLAIMTEKWLPTLFIKSLFVAACTFLAQLMMGDSDIIFYILSNPIGFAGIFYAVYRILGFHPLAQIRIVESMSWNWPRFRHRLLVGMGTATIFIGLIWWWYITVSDTGDKSVGFLLSLLRTGGVVVSILIAGAGFLYAVFGALEPALVTSKSRPNEGIRLSIKNGFMAFGLSLMIGALVGVFAGVLLPFTSLQGEFTLDHLLITTLLGASIGWSAGVVFWLQRGGAAALKHYMVRTILACSGTLTFRFSRLLDHAADLILMKKLGGSYIFIHRMLLEHFSKLESSKKDESL